MALENPFDCAEKQIVRRHDKCGEKIDRARIRNVAFISKGYSVDTTNPTTFKNNLLAGEKTGDVFILRNTNGEYDGGTALQSEGRGGQSTRPDGMDHSAIIRDFEIVPNVKDFWNNMMFQGEDFWMVMFTKNYAWATASDVDLSIAPKVPIVNDPKALIIGECTVTWTDDALPLPIEFDFDGFEDYPELTNGFVSNQGDGTLSGATLSVLNNASIALTVGFLGEDSASGTSDDAVSFEARGLFPSYLTLDKTSGIITGTAPAVDGSDEFIIYGENQFGIAGTITIKIITA